MRRRKLAGLFYVAPALAFVLLFTVAPFVQMLWMSLHNWSLLTGQKFIGLKNFAKAYNDSQFWVSMWFTLKYTLWITPILMIGGFLIALLLAEPGRLRALARGMVFVPVVIGLGVSSLLWYWLFSYDYGLINRALLDLGLISSPVLWFGANANLATWAVIASIVWKVMGFGMLLFIAAIQAIPKEIREAGRIDGANARQGVTRIVLPLTYRTILLVTLISIIGSLLAFDQFYIMTAGQPGNLTATSVFFIYLNSFPYLKLGYGAALSLILSVVVLCFTLLQLYLNRRLA
jgi:multiple sugar transport system permease protein